MEIPSGSCLPHCYKCPSSVVHASNALLVLSTGLVALLIGTCKLDSEFRAGLDGKALSMFECVQRKRMMYLVVGLACGSVIMFVYKPYTMYKLVD